VVTRGYRNWRSYVHFVINQSNLFSGLCSSVVGASDENIVESVLRDVYQGRFLPKKEMCLPTSPIIAAAKCHRQCMKDCELVLNSPAIHRSSDTALPSSG